MSVFWINSGANLQMRALNQAKLPLASSFMQHRRIIKGTFCAGLTCSADRSSLQLRVTDAEMLTPASGDYEGAPHVGAWRRLSIMLLIGLGAKNLSPSFFTRSTVVNTPTFSLDWSPGGGRERSARWLCNNPMFSGSRGGGPSLFREGGRFHFLYWNKRHVCFLTWLRWDPKQGFAHCMGPAPKMNHSSNKWQN